MSRVKVNSLGQDLKILINNPQYSDIEIICEDKEKFYGCRAILAARSKVLNGLLYNGMRESYEDQIHFPTIKSSVMRIILEFIHAGSINEEILHVDNIIEVYYAADYFQLLDLQEYVLKTVKDQNNSPELLSRVVETIQLTSTNESNDIFFNLLLEKVAAVPLNTIKFGRLSFAALRCLLSYIHGKERPLATPEYEIFRYSALLAAKNVSSDTFNNLMECLPTLEKLEKESSVNVIKKIVISPRRIYSELKPLIKFIDFKRIEGKILVDIIEPLEIVSSDTLMDVYRNMIKASHSNFGIPPSPPSPSPSSYYEPSYAWEFSSDTDINDPTSEDYYYQ